MRNLVENNGLNVARGLARSARYSKHIYLGLFKSFIWFGLHDHLGSSHSFGMGCRILVVLL